MPISGFGTSYAPDIDSITVPATTTQYLADAAQFNGKDIAIVASPEGTDGKKLAVSQGGHRGSIDQFGLRPSSNQISRHKGLCRELARRPLGTG
jgi:hypothetical protein